MGKNNQMDRREFLKRTGAVAAGAVAFPYLVKSSALGAEGAVAPSNKITMGAIGVGDMGTGDLRDFLGRNEIQMLAVCDVDTALRERAKNIVDSKYGNKDCAEYKDFREVIARKDIDAVMIATPDHWHSIPAVMAAKAGKDIHCQKPLAYTIAEGRAMVDTVKKYKRVWLTGSQQRSDRNFRYACELARNGCLGKIHTVEVGLPDTNSVRGGSIEPSDPPEGFDYEMWLGPAPWAPYTPTRCHWNFRWIKDYSGGQITDWAGHHCDIAQWGMNTEHTGPVEIEGKGVWPKHLLFNTVEHWRFVCKYKEGFTMVVAGSFPNGLKFIGDKGWVFVTRGSIDSEPKSLLKTEFGPNDIHLYKSDDHKASFVECVKTRKETVAPIEVAHRSISVGHLGVIAIMLERKLYWDPGKERFINDPGADDLLSRQMRGIWQKEFLDAIA
jgi:predicted dehydrogenase